MNPIAGGKVMKSRGGCQNGTVNLSAFKFLDLIDLTTVLQTSICLGVVKQANCLYPGLNPTSQSVGTS